MIAEHLSVEEVAGIKEAFESMDTCKRGKINLEELRVGLQKVGQHIPDADLQILMNAVSVFWPSLIHRLNIKLDILCEEKKKAVKIKRT